MHGTIYACVFLYLLDFAIAQQFCPGQTPGFLNDTCNATDPCFDDYSLECRDGVCSCRYGYIPTRNNNGLCEYAPSVYQPCRTECQKPLVCRYDTGSYNATTNTTTYPYNPYYPYGYPGKYCICDPPYHLVNGYSCVLDCPSDEYYDSSDGICKPNCQPDQVKLDRAPYCGDVADLGQPCVVDRQCVQEYSTCDNSTETCVCRPGFVESDGACVPEKYSCPFGEPIPNSAGGGGPLACNRTIQYSPTYYVSDSCPNGSYCQFPPPTYYSGDGQIDRGFCCPELAALTCPVGDPLEGVYCDYPPPPGTTQYCPYESHYCYSVYADSGYQKSVCCPRACPSDTVSINGRCYPHASYGQPCLADEQCAQANLVCSENGTCQCPENSILGGYPPYYYYCYVQCNWSSEVQYGNKCYKRKQLGESCAGDPINLCPYNSGCDSNGVCSCFCSDIQIGDNRCERYPVCNAGTYYYGYGPYSYDNCPSTTSSPPPDNSTTVAPPPISRNITFCRVFQDAEPPAPAVDQCPDGEYCSYYLPDLGLCCPKPSPVCPEGSDGTGTCGQQYAYSCSQGGQGYYCYTYYRAGSESASTCCPYQYYYYPYYYYGRYY